MLTLLFVLFVVLFSMSSVDQKKFAELAAGLSEGFGAQSAAFRPAATLDGVRQQRPRSSRSTRAPTRATAAAGTASMTETSRRRRCSAALQARSRAEASAGRQGGHQGGGEPQGDRAEDHRRAGQGQAARTRSSSPSTSAAWWSPWSPTRWSSPATGPTCSPAARKILDAIAPTLAKLPNNIEVDGNTNQLKATTTYYPSGWELSAARASTVVRYLIGHGLAKDRMSAVGLLRHQAADRPDGPAVGHHEPPGGRRRADHAHRRPGGAAAGRGRRRREAAHRQTTARQAAADAKADGTTESTSDTDHPARLTTTGGVPMSKDEKEATGARRRRSPRRC